jgi:hypothetical protein
MVNLSIKCAAFLPTTTQPVRGNATFLVVSELPDECDSHPREFSALG